MVCLLQFLVEQNKVKYDIKTMYTAQPYNYLSYLSSMRDVLIQSQLNIYTLHTYIPATVLSLNSLQKRLRSPVHYLVYMYVINICIYICVRITHVYTRLLFVSEEQQIKVIYLPDPNNNIKYITGKSFPNKYTTMRCTINSKTNDALSAI